jgi:hypothetical protein
MAMYSTNYVDTFIAVAGDSKAAAGTAPKEAATASVALRAFRLIIESPYCYTSDDVLFTVYAERAEIPARERARARNMFLSKPQACLRGSELCKRYGWGVHHDSVGRIALYAVESAQYASFLTGKDLNGKAIVVKDALRAKRL